MHIKILDLFSATRDVQDSVGIRSSCCRQVDHVRTTDSSEGSKWHGPGAAVGMGGQDSMAAAPDDTSGAEEGSNAVHTFSGQKQRSVEHRCSGTEQTLLGPS